MTDAALQYYMLYFDLIVKQGSDDFSEDDELQHAEQMDVQWDKMTFDEQQEFRRIISIEPEPTQSPLNFVDQEVAQGDHTLARIPARNAA